MACVWDNRHGKEQQDLPDMRAKNGTAVHWPAALPVRGELEKGHWILRTNTGYGLLPPA